MHHYQWKRHELIETICDMAYPYTGVVELDLLPAPVHHRCTSSQPALIRCIYDDSDITSPSIMSKPASIPVSTFLPLSGLRRYRHSELTPTMSVRYNNSETCPRNQFRNYCYVVKIIPVLLKNISHFATKLYKSFMYWENGKNIIGECN
jgi:hypothetical protein